MKFTLNQTHKRGFILSLFLVCFVALLSTASVNAAPIVDNRFGITQAYRAPQAAYDSGASWELITIRWDEVQPGGPGEWSLSPEIDEWIPVATSSGREVVVKFEGTPAWATGGQPGTGVPDGLFLSGGDPANYWAAFVGQAVRHFSAMGVNHYIIWGDQNLPAGNPEYNWGGDVEEYYQLVKSAYLVANNVNPAARVHLGGYDAFDPAWFGHYLTVVMDDISAPANDYYFDAVSLHIDFSPETVHTMIANSYYLMSFHGIPLKEVWVTEMNARPAADPAYPADQFFTSYQNISADQQAAFIMQAFALAFDAGASRVAVHQLVDDLEMDEGNAMGLIREDSSPRPAYTAFQLITRYYSNFVYARRVDEESFPLIDYVRLTGASRVTHIAWARSEENATLVIPARTSSALLIDMYGSEWVVYPSGGQYRVVVQGAACDNPGDACVIGGNPWLLIEEGIPDLLDTAAPPITVELGGEIPTPDPAAIMTATAAAMPTATATPEPTNTPTPVPTALPTEIPEAVPTEAVVEPVSPEPEISVTDENTSDPVEETDGSDAEQPVVGIESFTLANYLRPEIQPYLLMGGGIIVILAGFIFFIRGEKADSSGEDEDELIEDPEDVD